MPHVDALYDFVVAYKKRLVPDYAPKAPVKKVKKDKEYDGANKQPTAPIVDAAKSGRATSKISQEKIEKDELRVGLPVFARGQQVTAWAKASEFSKALRFETAPDNRSKCMAAKEKITKGEIRLCARVGTFAQLEGSFVFGLGGGPPGGGWLLQAASPTAAFSAVAALFGAWLALAAHSLRVGRRPPANVEGKPAT